MTTAPTRSRTKAKRAARKAPQPDKRVTATLAFLRGHVTVWEQRDQTAALETYLRTTLPSDTRANLRQYREFSGAVKAASVILRAPRSAAFTDPDPWRCPSCKSLVDGEPGTECAGCRIATERDNNWDDEAGAAEPQAAWPLATANVRLVEVPAAPSPPVAEPLNQERTDEDEAGVWQTWTGPTVTSGNGDGNGIGELDEEAERHFAAAFEDTPDSPDVPGPVELPPDVPGPETPAERQADPAFDQTAGGAE